MAAQAELVAEVAPVVLIESTETLGILAALPAALAELAGMIGLAESLGPVELVGLLAELMVETPAALMVGLLAELVGRPCSRH